MKCKAVPLAFRFTVPYILLLPHLMTHSSYCLYSRFLYEPTAPYYNSSTTLPPIVPTSPELLPSTAVPRYRLVLFICLDVM